MIDLITAFIAGVIVGDFVTVFVLALIIAGGDR